MGMVDEATQVLVAARDVEVVKETLEKIDDHGDGSWLEKKAMEKIMALRGQVSFLDELLDGASQFPVSLVQH